LNPPLVGVIPAPPPLPLPLNALPTCESVLALPVELGANPRSPPSGSVFSPKGEGTYAGTGFLASLFPVDAPEFLRESGGLGVALPFEFEFEFGYAEGGGGDTGPYREFVF